MKFAIVDGFTEDPATAGWSLAVAARLITLGHTVSIYEWDLVTKDQLTGNDGVVVYSWGTAGSWHQCAGSPITKRLVILVGVPNMFMGQFGFNFWNVDPNVDKAVALTLNWWNDKLIIDYGIKDPDAMIDFSQALPTTRLTNLACDKLPVNHGTLPYDSSVQDFIVNFLVS